ncbi:MAG: DUF2304 domain-containing protein [Acidimicrobiales bacterium]
MSTGAHLLLIAVTGGTIYVILRLVRRQVLRAKYSLLWVTVGFGLLLIAAWPALLDLIANSLGVNYQPALFLMLAVAFLLILVVHFSFELSRLESRVRTLAEEIALLRHDADIRTPELSDDADSISDEGRDE